jgi:hypothetical protein
MRKCCIRVYPKKRAQRMGKSIRFISPYLWQLRSFHAESGWGEIRGVGMLCLGSPDLQCRFPNTTRIGPSAMQPHGRGGPCRARRWPRAAICDVGGCVVTYPTTMIAWLSLDRHERPAVSRFPRPAPEVAEAAPHDMQATASAGE